MKTTSIAVETSRSTSPSDSIVRQTNKRSFLSRQILKKLQKLDNIEVRLDNLHKSIASLEGSFAFLEKDVQNLKDKTKKTRTKVDELGKSVEFREVDTSDMQKYLQKVQHEAEELKMQLLYQEHDSRRENLMFLGIQENDAPTDTESGTENNNVENTKELIYNFLQKELSLENAVSRFEFHGFIEWGKDQVRSHVLLLQDFSDIPIGKKSYYVQGRHSKGNIMVFLRTCRRNFIS